MVKTGQASSGSTSASLQTSATEHKLSVHPGLKTNLATGLLSDRNSGQPRYMSARPGAPRCDGVFNEGYVRPLVDRSDDWKYFTEGITENSAYGTAEQVAHEKLGGQRTHFRNNVTPTADQVQKLREEQGGSIFQDPTSGIDIIWVPEMNLGEGSRAQQGVSNNSHRKHNGDGRADSTVPAPSSPEGSSHRRPESVQPAANANTSAGTITQQQPNLTTGDQLRTDDESSDDRNERIDADETRDAADEFGGRPSVERTPISSNAAHKDGVERMVHGDEIPKSGKNFGWEPRSKDTTQSRGVETIDPSNQIKPRLRSDVARGSVADATAMPSLVLLMKCGRRHLARVRSRRTGNLS